MVATHSGRHIHSVVPHVVEVCSREQECALLLLRQMGVKTVVHSGQARKHRNATIYHAQVSVVLYVVILFMNMEYSVLSRV